MSDLKILVQQVTGTNFVLNVHSSDTVMDVKQKIQGHTGVSPIQQRLLCGEEYLTEPHETLRNYGVKNEATILLVPRGATIGDRNNLRDEL